MTSRALLGCLAFAGLVVGIARPLGAEESRPALNAPLILNLLAVPMERPEVALQESLRVGSAARAAREWEALPDGSYRYGNATLNVIIKNPCPDGTLHTPLALPGRNRR
ncbi:MAG: hypothetical protein HY725_02070 [Candidatus Rokubacteria bacterium]|nr:hypothetical protein [Candidatus Rokubacteria bacterium]